MSALRKHDVAFNPVFTTTSGYGAWTSLTLIKTLYLLQKWSKLCGLIKVKIYLVVQK